jgi:hypothetical protein
MKFVAIVGLTILSAMLYGIVHNQFTTRICVEYLTIGHPPIFGTDDPTLLGLGWGILATWWVGLLLGVPLAMAARLGSWPRLGPRSLIRPIAWLMVITASFATAAGVLGYLLARNGTVFLVGHTAARVPADRHVPFLACLWTHSASYLVGFVGGIIVIVRVGRLRFHLARRLT